MIAAGGESDTLAVLDEEACQKCIEANRDVIVGVKVRLSAEVCGKGSTEEEAYRYVHLFLCFISIAEMCGCSSMFSCHFFKREIYIVILDNRILTYRGKNLHRKK